MGAICGLVTLGNPQGTLQEGSSIFERLKIYPFDKIKHVAEHEVFFGCGISFNTPESLLEDLPRKNSKGNYLITSDAIIDNRDELLKEFCIDPVLWSSNTDSELILLAYDRWGNDCPKHLIGDYAFAIWDLDKRELFCTRDAVGTRTLYYCYEEGVFGFCTIEKPLLGILNKKVELNEKWIADFLAIDGIQHEIEYEETVYQGIYQLPPAFYGIWSAEGFKNKQYWDPLLDHPPIRYETDEEYVEEFNRIFSEAVACRLRSVGETGIMLSGGMDSGSIACVAAEHLAKDNRNLYAYSSVPVKDFDEEPGNTRAVFNETPEVELVVNAYPNIDITYCRFEGKNSLTDMNTLLQIFEQPYKIFQNMTWYHSILQLAATKNCRIILNGQVGNATISYGDFRVHLLTLFRAGKLTSCFREIMAMNRLLNQPVKKVFKLAVEVVMPYKIRSWRERIRNRNYDRFRDVLVNRSLIAKWGVENRLDRIQANILTNRFLDYEEDRKLRISPLPFTHIGAIETKLSLANRITIRDPSRDRRVLQFCLSIPSDQYVRNGNERYLLRRAMKGILPDPIRNNIKTRGIQSADWIHRLMPEWDKMRSEIDQIIAQGEIDRYVDMDKIKELRAKWDDNLPMKDESAVRSLLIGIIFSRFINDHNRKYIDPDYISNHNCGEIGLMRCQSV